MNDSRAKRALHVPGKVVQPIVPVNPLARREKRRGVRVNSQVPISVQWDAGGQVLRKETQTRVVGPYGCLLVMSQNLELEQKIKLTNLVSKQTIPAVVVWRGHERAEGWEFGIELVNPQMGFWGLEL